MKQKIIPAFLVVLMLFATIVFMSSSVFAIELPDEFTLPEAVDDDDYILFFNTYESDGNIYLKGMLLDNVIVADLKYSAGQYSSGQYYIDVYLLAKRYDLYELDTQNGTAWNATLNKSATLQDNGYYKVSSLKFDDASYIYSFPYDVWSNGEVIYTANPYNAFIQFILGTSDIVFSFLRDSFSFIISNPLISVTIALSIVVSLIFMALPMI